jgi:predicted ATPase
VGIACFGGHFSNFLQREVAKAPELLDRLLIFAPEDALEIEYSPRGDGTGFRAIGQASAGQRAAAMLAFLLAHGTEPIVLDQPEDDLDNHLIYQLVVRQIRENKVRRQLIVVTHNPNIVVNGDAEMVYALGMRGGACRVQESGSLQEPSVRREVCDVMEGGREAFHSRYIRLGGTP